MRAHDDLGRGRVALHRSSDACRRRGCLVAAALHANAALHEEIAQSQQLARVLDVGEGRMGGAQLALNARPARMLGPSDQRRMVDHLAQVLQRLEGVLWWRLLFRLLFVLLTFVVVYVDVETEMRVHGLAGLGLGKVLIQVDLHLTHLAVVVLYDLGRQVVEHLVLGASQQEGQHLLVQRLERQHACLMYAVAVGRLRTTVAVAITSSICICVAVAIGRLERRRRDTLGVLLIELLLGAQVAGYEEVEQAPQFGHVVLYGRAGEYEAMGGAQLLDRLGQLGLGALDEVALVEYAVVPLLLAHVRDVVTHRVVRGDENIVVVLKLMRRWVEEDFAQLFAFAHRARVDERPQTSVAHKALWFFSQNVSSSIHLREN